MTDGRRRTILIGGALAAVAIIVAGVFVLWPASSDGESAKQTPQPRPTPTSKAPLPSQTIEPFLKALKAGKAAEAAALTDNPAAAQEAIAALYKNVPVDMLDYTASPAADPKATTVPVTVTLKVSSPISWKVSMPLAEVNGKTLVKWAPTVLHPKLQAGQTIAVFSQSGQPGEPAVVDDTGQPLAIWEGATAKPKDVKIAPSLLQAIVSGTSSGGGSSRGQYVAIVDQAGKDVELLFGEKPPPASTQAVKSTLNAKIVAAAQNAVDKSSLPTMIVAIRPTTGGILAVAQNDAATTSALSGLYSPGSSFKIATATAAIEFQDLNAESVVQCPGSGKFGTRTVKNQGFELASPKLRTAFAKSCNTTFGEIASKLSADGLSKAASQLGLNADFDIPGIKSELGNVEATDNVAQRVEDSIGQGKVVASPLGMAMIAATVAGKRAITPKLRTDIPTKVLTGYQPPPGPVLDQLRTMMRDVVTSGTATALSKYGAVHGKTGTAETESQGDNANGWFVGFRGDVAFAVLVVDGKSSAQAVTVTANFLSGF